MSEAKRSRGPVWNLLVVDDDADTRIALRNYLQAAFADLAVETASYGAEAMRKIEASPVDVLLTDQNMPGMPGTQLVAWARERHPTIRCLMMSADEDPAFEQATAALGVHVFRKPFTPVEMMELVNAMAASGPATAD
ncbi:MAG: response regulator transcription factor [Thermoplasmatota archaeon]